MTPDDDVVDQVGTLRGDGSDWDMLTLQFPRDICRQVKTAVDLGLQPDATSPLHCVPHRNRAWGSIPGSLTPRGGGTLPSCSREAGAGAVLTRTVQRASAAGQALFVNLL